MAMMVMRATSSIKWECSNVRRIKKSFSIHYRQHWPCTAALAYLLPRLVNFGSKAMESLLFGQIRDRLVRNPGLILMMAATTPLRHGEIPMLGLGLSHNGGGFCRDAVVAACEAGYMLFDTAQRYNTEAPLGALLKELGIDRKTIFLTSKVWTGNYGDNFDKAFHTTCCNLHTDFLDLFLVHWPDPGDLASSKREGRRQLWRKMELLVERDAVKNIGVSNFQVSHLEQLLEDCSIPPAINQCEFNPFQQPNDIIDFCRDRKIVFQGYCPLAKGEGLKRKPVLAIAEKVKKTPAQVLIKWSLQRGAVTIPKSTRPQRVRENIDVFDFQLSTQQMDELNQLHEDLRVTWDPTSVE
eukprot:m.102313 g.102313  ORF g.102313 m.102313 type:complete len:353 (+) comp22334_c0_seq4:823-1881(+)